MKKLQKIIILLALTLTSTSFLTSCQTKQHAINQLQSLSDDLQYKSRNYDSQDWQKAADRFAKVRKDINRHDYSPEEWREIGKLEGQCATYFVKGVKDGIFNEYNAIKNEIIGILQGIGNSTLFQ